MDWHFEKKTIRLIAYVYKHQGKTEAEIIKHFNVYASQVLKLLSDDDYLYAEDKIGKRVEFTDKSIITPGDTKWFCMPKACVIVENKNWELWRWLLPLIFSALALGISLVNLIIKLYEISNAAPISTPLPTVIPTLPPIP